MDGMQMVGEDGARQSGCGSERILTIPTPEIQSMQRCGFTPSAIFLVATTSLILSCHDGKSSVPSSANPSGMAQVVGTSFSSTPLVPGGAAPEQFRDEAIQIRFDGPIDPLALGG
ncbi:MAG: hypothetical protein KDB18_14425, partial [Salinibacterium sp.]|nr:hypothetical protein [Salinibacterium sp.]